MNLYGVVTGTNAYTLNVSVPAGFSLQVGDTVTIRPLNANTGASTLDIGLGAMPLTLNGAALTAGQLEAGKDRQCTFVGSGFALDNAGGNLSAAEILAAGLGGSPGQSYGNLGGSGARASFITATSSASLFGAGSASWLVNAQPFAYFNNGISLDGSQYIRFDFGTARLITEAKWYQGPQISSHGTWKWQGSQNASAWSDIGSSFTLGGATAQTQTQLNGNTTAYRYYQLVSVSGTTVSAPYLNGLDFKIDDQSAAKVATLNVVSNLQVPGTANFGSVPNWPAQSGNYVFAGPIAASAANGAAPAFRALVANDIPSTLGATTFSGAVDAQSYLRVRGSGVGIPAGGAWTTVLGGVPSNTLTIVTVETKGFIQVWWSGTTLTKVTGNSSDLLVASSAGATELAFRVSGGNLQISNGTGVTLTAKLCEWIGG